MVTPAYQTGHVLEPLLEMVELRAKTVTFVYSYYERGVKQLCAVTLPISFWRLMDYTKVRSVGAVIVDMEVEPTNDDDNSDFQSADLQTLQLGSF